MPIFDIIIYGVFIPAVVAGVIQLGVWFADKGERKKYIAQPGTAVAYTAALLTGFILLIGMPALPPVEASDAIILGAIAAALVGIADSVLSFPLLAQFLYRIIIAVSTGWFLINPTNEYLHEGSNGFILLAVFALVTFAVWRAISYGNSHRGPGSSFQLLALLSLATMTMMLAGSLKFGQMTVTLTAAVGASWVVSFFRPRFTLAPAGIGAIAMMFTGLLFGAHYYADLPLSAMVLLLISTLVAPIVRATKLKKRWNPWLVFALSIVVIVILAGTALFLSYQSSPPLEPYNPY